ALVDVRAQRNLHRLEVPGDQALISHLAVARFVVGPAGSVVNPFPRQYVCKGALNHAASFDRPNFVEVADGGAELKLHAFAVGIIWIDYVRPVKAAWPKTRVSGVVRGNGVSFRSRQRPGGGRRC